MADIPRDSMLYIIQAIQPFPDLIRLSHQTLNDFLELCSRQWGSLSNPTGDPCEDIPPATASIFSAILQIPKTIVDTCWTALCHIVHTRVHQSARTSLDDAIRKHAVNGVGGSVISPPVSTCINPQCSNKDQSLGEATYSDARLYTLSHKVLPVRSQSLYCRSCNTRYYPDYYVQRARQKDSRRIYYSVKVPDVLHVSQSVFVDSDVSRWIRSMFLAQNAAYSISRVYNETMRMEQFNTQLTHNLEEEVIYDSFYLYALLLDNSTLEDPQPLTFMHHVDRNSDRWIPAIRRRNARMQGTGQEMWAHGCYDCVKFRQSPDGQWSFLTAAVTDGVTLGYRCCSSYNCHISLAHSLDRFCPHHSHLALQCAVKTCDSPILAHSLACSDPQHQAAVKAAKDRSFTKEKRERDKRDKQQGMLPGSDQPDLEQKVSAPQGSKSTLKIKAKSTFTNNEQLVVRCCGIIVSRATCVGVESVSSTADLLKATFPRCFPGCLPCYCFYDKNCQLMQHLHRQNDHYFDDCGMPIDVFHFKKSTHTHNETCRTTCSPYLFRELKDADGKWLFNTSIAEQINAWFGGFQSIVQPMTKDKYNFFLDEMIALHNRRRVEDLGKKGAQPHFIPMETLCSPRQF